ncbi:MFS transporter [Sodalis ligni]|uniref:ACS family tartrate transporter-like MFS transporter n=1 Tax=Sodalis ligni TaxID=2697027 RepID=A0A4R1N951_9GAMM|nr:MFS transporter [Sodalis ligni]TCL03197.1 ACS family tartrate transporter-like MFS transporter [Sodalis ligni]
MSTPLYNPAATSVTEQAVMGKIFRHLLPIMMIGYFIAFLDRVNIGFAATQMHRDFGFSATVYGFGAGLFFISYFLFEIPSNLALRRFGARLWISRIMLTWGVVSALTAMVVGEKSFYFIRFLLGAAEAGFFPGIIFTMTLWLPSAYRARMIAIFYIASPVAIAFGAVISAPLLALDGTWGLWGWQWLFIVEAIPAVVMAGVFWRYMPSSSEKAPWLNAEEKVLLAALLEKDRANIGQPKPLPLSKVFAHPGVLWLSACYFGLQISGMGLALFLPQIVAGFGKGIGWTGIITSIPYAFAAVALPFWGRYSDAHPNSRRGHTATASAFLALSLAACVFTKTPAVMIVLISIAAFCNYAFAPPFFAFSSTLMSGAAAAAGLAMINSVGALGAFVGPFVMGWVRDTTGSYTIGLLAISSGVAFSCIALLALRRETLIGTPQLQISPLSGQSRFSGQDAPHGRQQEENEEKGARDER